MTGSSEGIRGLASQTTGGKKRLLGIPMVKDRVVQTGLWLVLMPI